ncbi:FAD synthetase family protein [Nitratireductor alexandrii]|uniref:FAD synthetase family protein n=1 Tax=Nitratireductor alexandrii TaxID=2448161 RepID=UPI0013E04B6E|nr:FAD synthetase family protein [Nitratireductor alexandrii]
MPRRRFPWRERPRFNHRGTLMRLVRSFQELADGDRRACAAIGNFDGVHFGHRAIIDTARKQALRHGGPLGVVTFEPHPRAFFSPHAAPFRLTDCRTRAERLERLGVDCLFELAFDREMAGLSPEDFARLVICDGLDLRHVVVGENFRFGKARAGTTDTLLELGRALGFGVTVLPLLRASTQQISSTAIRNALLAGQPRVAARGMGEFHRIAGRLRHVQSNRFRLTAMEGGRVRTDLMEPRAGLYSVGIQREGGARLAGTAAIGHRLPPYDKPLEIDLRVFGGDASLHVEEACVVLLDYHGCPV